jgi:hypothetical protein
LEGLFQPHIFSPVDVDIYTSSLWDAGVFFCAVGCADGACAHVWPARLQAGYIALPTGGNMHDQEKTAMGELAFKLGRITRHAMYQATEGEEAPDLSKIATEVLDLGASTIAPDVLMMFVAGFHETDPRPERRTVSIAGAERD